MNRTLAAALTAAAAATIASQAKADQITGTITADNHYSLYTSTSGAFSYHGGNELGSAGDPGTYNWSIAEDHEFAAGDFLYIAAWSDDSVAQGVLGQFQFSSGMGDSGSMADFILSGDPRWQVYGTGINRGDGDAHPAALEIADHVAFADLNSLWEAPFVGATNGSSPEPWGMISGISESAQWMWRAAAGDENPLIGGSGEGEMLIFRTAVPAPGAAAMIALGGLTALRRRR